jgi:hypothetical protein
LELVRHALTLTLPVVDDEAVAEEMDDVDVLTDALSLVLLVDVGEPVAVAT